MNKLIINSLLILLSAAIAAPAVRAEKTSESPATETRTEELKQEIEDPLQTEESLEDFEEEAEGEPQTLTEDAEDNVAEPLKNDDSLESFEEEAESEPQTRTEDVQQSVETDDPMQTEESLEEAEGEPQTRTEDVQQSVEENPSSSSKTDAFEFVSSAYQGLYEDQGIPGFDQLFTAYTSGELTAEKLVMMGVEKGILSSEMMDDEAYISAVDSQLQSLENS